MPNSSTSFLSVPTSTPFDDIVIIVEGNTVNLVPAHTRGTQVGLSCGVATQPGAVPWRVDSRVGSTPEKVD